MIYQYEVLMGREIDHPLSEDLKVNLIKLLEALNIFRKIYSKSMFYWRQRSLNLVMINHLIKIINIYYIQRVMIVLNLVCTGIVPVEALKNARR